MCRDHSRVLDILFLDVPLHLRKAGVLQYLIETDARFLFDLTHPLLRLCIRIGLRVDTLSKCFEQQQLDALLL